MRVAYFDCFAGVSGDMILGALLDCGVKLEDLQKELSKLNVSGFHLEQKTLTKNGISGVKVIVTTDEQKTHRHLKDISNIIISSDLSDEVKTTSLAVFKNLAEAEAKVHNTTVDKIHFHEVGALDAIVDIVGSVIALDLLKIDSVYVSPISLGRGFVKCDHGTIPVPVPAVVELLKNIPVKQTEIETEICTPTGAAIMKTIARQFGLMPPMIIKSSGYGAGTKDLPIPNLLRVVIGEISDQSDLDELLLLEANIDDMNPEFFGFVMEKLFEAGALDVWMTNIMMKKNRPAVMLSALSKPADVKLIKEIILSETTTLGIRQQLITRDKLKRELIEVSTEYGTIRVKAAYYNNKLRNFTPEYDDCKIAAIENNVAIHLVYEAAKKAAENKTQH